MNDKKEQVWINANDQFVTKKDERVALDIYRTMKCYWQLILGFLLGMLFTGVLMK
jgi:hypothetical protein